MSELQKKLDQSLGKLVVNLIPKSKKLSKLGKKPKILLIKNKAIGDSIYTLPLLKALNKEFKAEIDVLCDSSNAKVFQSHKFINNILNLKITSVSSKINHYDLAIDAEPWSNVSAILAKVMAKECVGFSHSERSKLYNKTIKYNKKQHIVKTYLGFFSLFSKKKPSDELVSLNFSSKAKNKAAKLIKNNTIGMAVGVSGNAKTRMWPKERWIELIKKIKSEGFEVVLLGTVEDFDLAKEICKKTNAKNLHGKTNLEEFFAVISYCSAFVGCDSGPIHVAAAQNVPTIGLFGPNTPVIWAPYGRKNISLFHKNPGVPTIDNTNPYFSKPTKAEKKAMEDISVEEVFDSLKKILA